LRLKLLKALKSQKILVCILSIFLSQIALGQSATSYSSIYTPYKYALLDSLKSAVYATQGLLALKASSLINSQSQDCTQFSDNRICMQFGGSSTKISSPKITSNSIFLNGAYRISNQWRLGAYVDAGNITSEPNLTYVKQNGNNPIFGAYSVYSDKIGGQEFNLRLGANIGSTDLDITLPALGNLGSLSRSINIKAQSYLALVSTHLIDRPKFSLLPYLGTTFTSMNIEGSNNNSSRLSNLPIIFNGVSTKIFALQLGFNAVFRPVETVTIAASAGIQHTLSSNISNMSMSSLSTNTSFTGQTSLASNTPTFMFLTKYRPLRGHELTAKITYRQEVYERIGVTSYMLNYSFGF
jgi:hypothetical protein